MPEVSVIIPVYKVEHYLRRCLDSILSQTFQDFELILVDDGSPDGSGAICDEYAARDGRVRVLHQENGGVSSARNAGLALAGGEYIYFCDGDDYIESNLLLDAVSAMDGCDMVVFQYEKVDPDGRRIKTEAPFHVDSEKWKDPAYRSRFLAVDYFYYALGFEVMFRLLRREIVEKHHLRFPVGISVAEDLFFVFCYLLHTESVCTLPDRYYHYVIHPGSIMAEQGNKHNFQNNNEVSKALLAYMHRCPDCALREEHFPFIHYGVMNNSISRAKKNNPSFGVPDIRAALYAEIRDIEFFREQAAALLKNKPLLFRDMGTVRAMRALTEWTYYLNGREVPRRLMTCLTSGVEAASRVPGMLLQLGRTRAKE